MSPYNTSSAHKLPEQTQRPERSEQRKLRVVKTPKQFLASFITWGTVRIFIGAVAVVCLMVYNYVCLNEVATDINTLKAEMLELENTNVKLMSEVGATVNPRAIAELAETELGLKRLDDYQTRYLYLYHEDKIEVAVIEEEASLGEKARTAFNSAIDTVKEYISGR
jgi:cell division protein FtsL